MAQQIEGCAFIGDRETAALIGRDSSVNWLAFPRFDSPACCAALVGTAENGRWLIAPQQDADRVERRYRECQQRQSEEPAPQERTTKP